VFFVLTLVQFFDKNKAGFEHGGWNSCYHHEEVMSKMGASSDRNEGTGPLPAELRTGKPSSTDAVKEPGKGVAQKAASRETPVNPRLRYGPPWPNAD
jgi:hypothetical protein